MPPAPSPAPSPSAGRPPTLARRGLVTAPHYLASQAGLAILRRGGNAVEAALAAASTIAVVYPHMNSLGGDNFWLIFDGRRGRLLALNGSGRAGRRCSLETYRARGYRAIPSRGPLAANTVPGAVSAWGEAHRYSQAELGGSVPWRDLLADAIHYAAEGFPVSRSQARWTVRQKEDLASLEGFRRVFLRPDGGTPREGDLFVQPDLAETLRRLAAEGATAFYRGQIPRRICQALAALGGLLTEEDFAGHTADWVDPIRTDYRGHTVCTLPPNTQGVAALALLNLLETFDLKKIGEGGPDYYHLMVEATKLAFADRDEWIADPAFVGIPVEALLDKGHARRRARLINMKQAAKGFKPGLARGDTVFLATADAAGNVVALIQSIYFDFGSGVVAGDTGVLLQNRGSFFSLDPSHLQRIEPGKRPFHTLIPSIALKGGKPFLAYGTMGGEGQPQTQAALLTRIVDFGFDVQAAIEAPRWLYGRTWGKPVADLALESRIPSKVIDDLRGRGHSVRVVEPFSDVMGHAQAIYRDEAAGTLWGGADPRGGGAALGF